jgi:hypothetical protein
MAISITFATGSAVTISTTEISLLSGTSTLQTNTTVGLFQAVIDTNNLAAGDVFEWRLYEKAIAAGTKRLAEYARIGNAQGKPNWISPAVTLGAGWDMTLIKVAGTDRAFDWSIRSVS